MTLMNIKPGIGIGEVRFGITEIDLIKTLGTPNLIKEGEYVPDSGDLNRELIYHRGLSFTFDLEDNYRLCTISVTKGGYNIFGRDIIGLPMSNVKSFISKKTGEIPKHEDWSSIESPAHALLDYDSLGLFLWFNNDILNEIQFSYLFEPDGNTVKWPN